MTATAILHPITGKSSPPPPRHGSPLCPSVYASVPLAQHATAGLPMMVRAPRRTTGTLPLSLCLSVSLSLSLSVSLSVSVSVSVSVCLCLSLSQYAGGAFFLKGTAGGVADAVEEMDWITGEVPTLCNTCDTDAHIPCIRSLHAFLTCILFIHSAHAFFDTRMLNGAGAAKPARVGRGGVVSNTRTHTHTRARARTHARAHTQYHLISLSR